MRRLESGQTRNRLEVTEPAVVFLPLRGRGRATRCLPEGWAFLQILGESRYWIICDSAASDGGGLADSIYAARSRPELFHVFANDTVILSGTLSLTISSS